MSITAVQQRIKPWVLPFAMLAGVLFHDTISVLQWIVPYLIFTMLFITFCRVRPSELRFSAMMWILLCVQFVGSVLLFIAIQPINLALAQSVFICVFCPTATAAPVVTGMLGGNIGRVAAYSILVNMAVALVAPFLFVWVGGAASGMTFFQEFCSIAVKVAPLIVFPLVVAFALYYFARPVHDAVEKIQGISFYLWAVSLIIVVGNAVSFILAEPSTALPSMLAMAILAGVVCVVQFYIGRKVGRRYGDPVSAAQSLGQKNTVLAIWMALTYFDPVSSIGPAAYIVWQNGINSAQLYFKMRKEKND
ncbi:MAG: transporter [Muribaculaceae bacterium]|nr:transporter [Muribaculaceae bacterium]